MAEIVETPKYQVYIKNRHTKLKRAFRKIPNPESSQYGKYGIESVIESKVLANANKFFATLPSGSVTKTYFEDVFLLQIPKTDFLKIRFPLFIKKIEQDHSFETLLKMMGELPLKKDVIILPKAPKMGAALKRRMHTEFMKLGLQGKTLLSPIDSYFGEFPSVTVFTSLTRSIFSKTFLRKEEAPYQYHIVNTYLFNPEYKTHFRQLPYAFQGRASPDVYLEDPDQFVAFIEHMNEKRAIQGKPKLGFLNYFLYQNPHVFERSIEQYGDLPHSFLYWSAYRGLGKPEYALFEEEVDHLAYPDSRGFKRISKRIQEWARYFS